MYKYTGLAILIHSDILQSYLHDTIYNDDIMINFNYIDLLVNRYKSFKNCARTTRIIFFLENK